MENSSLTKINKTRKETIFTILRQKSYLKLIKKYSSNKYSYNTICINNIIYNESCLTVAKFKDFLIFDDNTEFIGKSYNKTEISNILLLNALFYIKFWICMKIIQSSFQTMSVVLSVLPF